MKLAISNIAWSREEEPQLFDLLAKYQVEGVEVAPTVLHPEWQDFSTAAGQAYRQQLAARNIEVCALQSLLFGRPDLNVFDTNCYPEFLEHIDAVAAYAAALGAKVLVFGSPKNRLRGALSMSAATEQAIPFLRDVGAICQQHGCVLGWEHNPVEYNCDFITNFADVCELVAKVDHSGVRVHGDAGGLMMTDAALNRELLATADCAHFHISAPFLAPVYLHRETYAEYLRQLWDSGYRGWISIEMKRSAKGLEDVEQSLACLRELIDAL